MTMRLSPCAWSDDVADALASAVKWFPLESVEDYRLAIANDPSTALYRCDDDEGLVGYFVLKVDHYTQGSEGVILAAAMKNKGVDMVKTMLPEVEKLFHGVDSYSIATARPGLVRKLQRAGWLQTHAMMRKVAPT